MAFFEPRRPDSHAIVRGTRGTLLLAVRYVHVNHRQGLSEVEQHVGALGSSPGRRATPCVL